MGWPILSTGKKLTGENLTVTPGLAEIKTYGQKMQDAHVTKSLQTLMKCHILRPAFHLGLHYLQKYPFRGFPSTKGLLVETK